MAKHFQPSEDIFDDVEAHGKRGPGIEAEATDDVEGHGLKMRLEPLAAEDADDVEGHRINQ